MAEFLKTFLVLTAGGSVLILLLLFLRYAVFRSMPATVYYYLWLLVFLRFALPIPSVLTEDRELPPQPVATHYHAPVSTHDSEFRIYVRPGIFPSAGNAEIYGSEAVPVQVLPGDADGFAFTKILRSLPWETLLFALWLAGFMISLARYVLGYFRFSSLIRRSRIRPTLDDNRCYQRIKRGRKPELIRSQYVRTPMLMGVFRPLLVLPDAKYTQEQLENIFLHELMHYRRRDIVYKWLSVPVYAAQWFNPLAYLMRREVNRACELSCDEMLIARMDRDEKQSYGDTLISLASAGRLPAGIVATTFTTEKRDLKERLVKIMKFKEKTFASILALVLSVALLAGCGAVAGPAKEEPELVETAAKIVPTPQPGETDTTEDGAVIVNNVDELLAAIAPGAKIRLAMGVYNLTEAADYGVTSEGKYYSWAEVYDGYELVIPGLDGLSITGSYEETTIATEPRYANVIRFVNCKNINLEAMVIGHTEKQGFCSGGVLYFDSCNDTYIDSCKLYGCGIIGIFAQNCKSLKAVKCSIYECSQNAVYSISSHSVVLENCDIHDCGEGMVQSVFTVDSSIGFAVVNSNIFANTALHLIDSRYSLQVSLLGCNVEENVFTEPMFWCEGYSVTVENCRFDLNHYAALYDRGDGQPKLPPVNSEGRELTEKDFIEMEQAAASYSGPQTAEPVELDETVDADGIRQVAVTTVDEFLAAIDDNTVITLDAPLFDLSTAADYGAYGNENYYWFNMYDGPGLVISGVENLSIVGDGAVISAIPRYANVLGFVNCDNIRLEGFTAGHTEEPGECAGGVLDFQNCQGIDILDCRLYGCGILGISASGCSALNVEKTEIYDCSQGAIALYATDGAVFTDCDIHDCHSPEISISDCSGVSFNGEQLKYGMFKVVDNKAIEFEYPKN